MPVEREVQISNDNDRMTQGPDSKFHASCALIVSMAGFHIFVPWNCLELIVMFKNHEMLAIQNVAV